jgi:hypothetical protein
MRTTVSLPDPLLDNARQSAAARGITFSALVEDALRHLLAKAPAGAAPPFRLHTVRGKPLDPELDLSRTSALLVREDEESYRRPRG